MNQMTPHKNMALSSFADKFKIDAGEMERALKSTVFRQSGGNEITNEQMVMLMVVAEQHSLNPFTKEIYAFPDKNGGVVPVVGVDGWSRMINSNRHFDGMEFNQSDSIVKENNAKNCPEWIEVVISRDDRKKPIIVREYLDECYRPPFAKNGYTNKGPWQTHTKRMLRHKAMIQGARIAFGFAGIYDEDEADRIMETNREAIKVDGVIVETVKQKAPAQNKAEEISNKLKRNDVKTVASEEIKETSPDITARGKAALKGKINKCRSLKSLEALLPSCTEFVGTEWGVDLNKAYSAKKTALGDG